MLVWNHAAAFLFVLALGAVAPLRVNEVLHCILGIFCAVTLERLLQWSEFVCVRGRSLSGCFAFLEVVRFQASRWLLRPRLLHDPYM